MALRRAIASGALAALSALALASCDKEDVPLIPPTITGPGVSTPVELVRRFEWQWNHRDTTRYGDLFAADFEFAFQIADTAGNVYARRVLTRDLEIAVGKAILVTGTNEEPPPVAVSLTFDPNLAALPDPRAGRSAIAHRLIGAAMLLRVDQPDIEIRGGARIYVVRGDSAAWPPGVPHAAAAAGAMSPRRLAVAAFAAALVAITASCSDPVEPPRDLDPPPNASTPESAVRRLA